MSQHREVIVRREHVEAGPTKCVKERSDSDFVHEVVAVILEAAGIHNADRARDADDRLTQWRAALAVRAKWGGERHYFAARSPEERAATTRRRARR